MLLLIQLFFQFRSDFFKITAGQDRNQAVNFIDTFIPPLEAEHQVNQFIVKLVRIEIMETDPSNARNRGKSAAQFRKTSFPVQVGSVIHIHSPQSWPRAGFSDTLSYLHLSQYQLMLHPSVQVGGPG